MSYITSKLSTVALATTLFAASHGLNAAVTIDENGQGFVGKGDVQQAFDWNNALLQSNAPALQFRFAPTGTVTWTCQGVNPAGRVVIQHYEVMAALGMTIAFDARKNRNGQITGFIMNGVQSGEGMAYSGEPGTCGNNGNGQRNWIEPPTLVGEINYEGSLEPTLEVSIDGLNWLVLPITYY